MFNLTSALSSFIFLLNTYFVDGSSLLGQANERVSGNLLNTQEVCDLDGAHKTFEQCFRQYNLQIYNITNNLDRYYLVIFPTDSQYVLTNSLGNEYLGVVYNRELDELVDRMYLNNSKENIINAFSSDYSFR